MGQSVVYVGMDLHPPYNEICAKIVKSLVVNGLLKLSHFRSSDLSHMPFYSEAHSLPPLSLCLGGGSCFL